MKFVPVKAHNKIKNKNKIIHRNVTSIAVSALLIITQSLVTKSSEQCRLAKDCLMCTESVANENQFQEACDITGIGEIRLQITKLNKAAIIQRRQAVGD